jgi:hypothetical protein
MSRQTEYFALQGGLDNTTPALDVRPGMVSYALNWEPTHNGAGYKEIDGYERYDGRTQPHTVSVGAARDAARAAITEVPGSGPVRGVWIHQGSVYAFRDNAGATACVMHQASASGWTAVSGVPTLAPGGSYEFVNRNFYGSTATDAMYGCDGVNKAFEFDGTTFTQITTGMTVDTPTHIAAHQKHLWLMFAQGSLQSSPIGNPTGSWSPVTGAAEIGLGANGTGLLEVNGDVLLAAAENDLFLLYGSSSADWQLKRHSFRSGAVAGTLQPVDGALFLDARGLRGLTTTSAFGDFEIDTRSGPVQDWLQDRMGTVRCSLISRTKNHYRLLFSDGAVLCGSVIDPKRMHYLTGAYPFEPVCACSADIDGEEYLLVGAADGFVYRLDAGDSFDGAAITSILRLPFNHSRSPDVRKKYMKAVMMMRCGSSRTFSCGWETNFGDDDYPSGVLEDFAVRATGGYWGSVAWDDFAWSGPQQNEVSVKLTGSGTNLAFILSGERTDAASARISGIRLHYDPRRPQR